MANAPENHPRYRPDIDGLRAVAVLGVVFYHAFPNWGRGGFVGVDIFFIISGFLISTILFNSAAAGRLSYLDFYDRRIRRIFPALIAVLLACLVFAATVAWPKDARLIGKHVIGGVGFASNFVLWNESGYFDWGSELKPLLHLWSLSVEEQYYIVWPVVVALLFGRSRWFVTALLVLLFGSFAINLALVKTDPTAAFYFPGARIWELLIGSGLAYLARAPGGVPALFAAALKTTPARASQGLSWSGTLLVAAGLVLTTATSAFPGWWALLPTFGAACLIGAGPHAWFNRQVLGSRAAVFVGKISYPLYLWHWPLLVFPTLVLGQSSRVTRIAAVLAAFVLAWLTYRYIETPIRFGKRRTRTPFALAGSMALLAGCGVLLMLSDGWADRYPPEIRQIATAEFKFDRSMHNPRTCFLAPEQGPAAFDAGCVVDAPAGTPRVWLWGDSHAESLYPGLNALGEGGKRFALTQFTASACPPVVGFTVQQRPHCREINDMVLAKVIAARPDVVLLAGNWSYYDGTNGMEKLDLAALQRTAAQLRAAGLPRVVVIGPVPRWEVSEPTILLNAWRATGVVPARGDRFLNRRVLEIDPLVRDAALQAGVSHFSPVTDLCNASGCEMTVTTAAGATYPTAWDDAHMTTQAAEVLVRRWQRPLLGDALIGASAAPSPGIRPPPLTQ